MSCEEVAREACYTLSGGSALERRWPEGQCQVEAQSFSHSEREHFQVPELPQERDQEGFYVEPQTEALGEQLILARH